MSRIDPARRTLRLKIVYAGPGLSGKTTNLKCLHQSLPTDRRGRLVSLATQSERTLFFDFMPVDIDNVGGYRLTLSLYTIPGQTLYRVSQQLILRDADAIVFVADSHPFRKSANVASYEALERVLEAGDRRLADLPIVMQYNKRDLPNRLPLEELEDVLNARGALFVPAIATEGQGVTRTLKEITRLGVKRALGGAEEAPARHGPGAPNGTHAARERGPTQTGESPPPAVG